jgi:hypothetical protein
MIRPRSCIPQFDDGIDDRINAHRELLLEKTGRRTRRLVLDSGGVCSRNETMRLPDLSDDGINPKATGN